MKYLITLILSVIACAIAYNAGQTEGKRLNTSSSQTSCVLAIRMVMEDICENPKSRCEILRDKP